MIIITGDAKVGKTTVCLKVIQLLDSRNYNCEGILSLKCESGNIEVFDISSKEKKLLAVSDSNSELRKKLQDKMFKFCGFWFLYEGIDFSNKVISKASSGNYLFIDELGPLELNNKGFTAALKVIASHEFTKSIITVRKSLLSLYIERLKSPYEIFETNDDNRNNIAENIFKKITLS